MHGWLLALLSLCLIAAAEKKPLFRMAFIIPDSDVSGLWAREAFEVAFTRLGYDLDVIPIPESRAYTEIMSGRVEGELVRAESYAKLHPDLLNIKVPGVKIKLMAYSIVPVHSWDELRKGPLRIDYKIGNSAAAAGLKDVSDRKRISELRETIQGFEKLAAGRSEVFLAYDVSAVPLLKAHGDLAKKIKYTTVLETMDAYTFLHPKNKELAVKLEKILQEMASSGSIESFHRQTEKRAIEIEKKKSAARDPQKTE